jgi:branched-subunit amino acid transport protein
MIGLPYLVAGGVLTFLTRLSFILLLGRIETPNWLTRALRFVPPAVLSAIIFQEVLIRDGALALSLDNLRLPAALLAGFIAWRTGNTLLTIAAGMVALWVLQGL